MNFDREKRIERVVEHFHRQYRHLYPNRKGLFILPKNEFDVPVPMKTFLCNVLISFLAEKQILVEIRLHNDSFDHLAVC